MELSLTLAACLFYYEHLLISWFLGAVIYDK